MQRALFGIFIGILLITASCTQRLACPAFQSAYIYDKDQLRKKFSYFLEDSTPKIYSASKTKYLIAEPTSYRKKVRALKTVEMKPINVAVPDSLSPNFDEDLGKEGADGEDGVVPGAELDLAARSVIDSTYIVDVPQEEPVASAEDSVYVISKDREVRLLKYNFPDSLKLDSASGRFVQETPYYAVVNVTFNVEQDNYMWYLRDYLVLPDVRLAKMRGSGGEDSDGESADKAKGKKEKKGGFFRNLFKKKKKAAEEEQLDETPPPPKSEEEEFDYIEEEEPGDQVPVTEEEPAKEEKKKGLFGRKKDRKPKEEKPQEEEPKEEPAEEEEKTEDPADEIPEKVEEDGF